MPHDDPAIAQVALEMLCERDIQKVAEVAGYPPLPPHGQWFADIIRDAQRRVVNSLVLASVGSLKSTVMNVLAVQDLLADDPPPQVLFASRSDNVVKATTRELRRIIYTIKGRQGDVWEAHMFNVPGSKLGKWPHCFGATTGSTIEGTRGKRGYPDDPIDDKSVDSAAARQDSFDWWGQKFVTRMDPGGTIHVIGSPWYVEDLYMQLIRAGIEAHGFPAKRHPCPKIYAEHDNFHWHGEEYDYLWPDVMNEAFLEGKRQLIGPSNFAQRYLCDPTALMGGLFQLKWFKYFPSYDAIPPRDELEIKFGVDLADSLSTTADLTAITVAGLHKPTNKIYILDCIAGKWETLEFERELMALADHWQPYKIIIEKTGQIGRINYLIANTGLPIVAQDAIRSKADRFRTMEAPVENGRIEYFDSTNVRDLVHEAVTFDPEHDRGHDDRLDSKEICIREWLHESERPVYMPAYGTR